MRKKNNKDESILYSGNFNDGQKCVNFDKDESILYYGSFNDGKKCVNLDKK